MYLDIQIFLTCLPICKWVIVMTAFILSWIHNSLSTISFEEIFPSIFSINSEAYASEFLENIEDISLRYYIHIDIDITIDHLQVCKV